MSESPASTPRKKGRWPLALSAALTAAGLAVAVGPGAAWIVDHAADGVRVWRLGRLRVDGVSGAWIGDLHAARASLRDENGVWAEAQDLDLRWRPLDLLNGVARIGEARASSILVARMPALTPARPGRGALDVHLDAITIEDLHLAEPVFGAEGHFSTTLSLVVTGQSLTQWEFLAARTDSDQDRLSARYSARDPFALEVYIEGAREGVLAHAFGAPAQALRFRAHGDGDHNAGATSYEGRLGEARVLSGGAQWRDGQASLELNADLARLPFARHLARRIGGQLAVSAQGARGGAFTAHARTPFLSVEFTGGLDDGFAAAGPIQLKARTERLSDIARESPFSLGPAELSGEVRRLNGTAAFRGALSAHAIEALGRRTAFDGPVTFALTPERFTLSADLRAPAQTSALFANARLTTAMNFDRARGRFTLERAALRGDAISLDAQGWANSGDGEFSGEWRARRLEALAPGLRGGADGRWRAFAAADGEQSRVWTTTFDGVGARVAGEPDIVPQLLGAAPHLDGRFSYVNGGLDVEHLRLTGAKLRAGASGRIVRGRADLALEASARGPLSLGPAEITGAGDATGRLSGPLSRPTLTANAQFAAINAGGVLIEAPNLAFNLSPDTRFYRGHGELRGVISGQPLSATANVALTDSGLALEELVAKAGALEARGGATLSRAGANARLALSGALDGLAPGVSGRIDGDATFTPETLSITANIADGRAGALFIRAAALSAAGPYEAVQARYDLRGRLHRAPLRFAGEARVTAAHGVTTLSAIGEGALADVAIATRAPLTMTWSQGAVETALDARLGDGGLTARWREQGRAITGEARVEHAPLGPLAAIWGERATGTIDGAISLASAGRGLSGAANLTLANARFAGRQRGTLDLHVEGALTPDRLRADIDARSSEGLAARFEAEAPVDTSAAPLRIAVARNRTGRATWSVRGPAASLWAAARLPDQALSGDLDGEGEVTFGAGSLAGTGRLALTRGTFEDKRTGVSLVDLDAAISLSESGVRIERFTAAGPHDGRLSASGGSANPREGSISVTLADMRVVDRPEAQARASGELTLAWEGLHSSLSGALDLAEADIDIAQNPQAGIPTLDVIEINRPDQEDDAPTPSPRNGSTALDVRLRAPGRVFTRGRGVDAEWSLDLRLAGTAQAPLLFGQARSVRGTLALSGQPFDIESGRIDFNGDPADARIDLVAQRDSADLSARISLSGTAADPEVSLTSEPGLPEDEILPQILFGRSVADLSAFEAAQIAAALASLSGRASFDLVDAARAAAGLDRFNVRQDEDGGFLVSGGVYLTRDVYLEVARTGLGQAATRVEWTVRPRLVLITSFLANGDQRASIRWRRESD